jgi:hypothetical protein
MQAPRGRKLLVFWLVLGAVCPLFPAAARADKKTIVMLEVEGEREPKLRKSLERMVKGGHEILPGATYRDASRRLRAQKLTPNNVKEVCRYLRVDGVLDGTLVQDEEGYRLVVRLRSGVDGIIDKKIPLRLKQPWLSDRMENQLAQRLMLAIDNLPSMDKDDREGTLVAAARDQDGAKGKKRRKGRDEEEEPASKSSKGKKLGPNEVEPDVVGADRLASAREEEAKEEREGLDETADEEIKDERPDPERTASSDGDDSGDGDGDEEGDEEGDDDEVASIDRDAGMQRSPRATPLLVNLGVSFIGRKLTFDYSGTDTARAPPGYDGTPVPGAYMTAETYLAGFGGETGPLANIGIGVVVDRVIGLNSTLDDGTGMLVKLPTRMWRYGANLRYRHNFGDQADGVSMHGAVGYNTAGFAISKSDAPGSVDVPNVNYKYIDIGVGGRVPVAGPLALLAEAKFLGLLNAGQIQTLEQYGPADVSGFSGEAVVEYQITDSVNARAGGRFMQVTMTFDGFGALDDRNSDGTQDVSGSSDRYLGGFVTAGYSF